MNPKPKPTRQDWFCVEDCVDPRRPILLLAEGTLGDCHAFIESCRLRGRRGVYRVNYSPVMRRYLKTNARPAA